MKTETEDWPVDEIVSQVQLTRDQSSEGNIHFSAKYFRDNYKNVSDVFEERVYQEEAEVPTYPWTE